MPTILTLPGDQRGTRREEGTLGHGHGSSAASCHTGLILRGWGYGCSVLPQCSLATPLGPNLDVEGWDGFPHGTGLDL